MVAAMARVNMMKTIVTDRRQPHSPLDNVNTPYNPIRLLKGAPPGQVLYCTVLYCTVLYCTVLYCTVMYRRQSTTTSQSWPSRRRIITSCLPRRGNT